MKKITISLVICLSILSIVFAEVQKYPVASLTLYIGEVNYKNKDKETWIPVQKGMVFYEGDKLKTETDGKAELFFYTGTKVRIANETEIEFTKDEKKKTKSVFVNFGTVWSKVRKGDKFEIESIHGVASVKGTELENVVNNYGMDTWVISGLVLIHNENGEVLAEKNTKTTMTKEGTPSKNVVPGSQMPKNEGIEAEAVLVVSSPGRKISGQPFKIFLSLKDPKKNELFKGEVTLKLKSVDGKLGFAMEKGSSEWPSAMEVKVVDGRVEIMAVAPQEGEFDLNISGTNLTGTSIPIKVQGEIKKRKVILKFIGQDNKEHLIEMNYKLGN